MTDKPVDSVIALEKKRNILQEVMTIAQSIEHIQSSLQNVIILGSPVEQLSGEIKKTYSGLEKSYQSQPSNKLKDDIGKLDKYIQLNLVKILEIVGHQNKASQTSVVSTEFEQQLIGLQSFIAGFKKSAFTSIALRVLLQKRGLAIAALSLAFSETVLRSQITFLETKEKAYRAKAISTINEMTDEIDVLLLSNAVPKAMKEVLLKNKSSLQANIKHIQSGKPLETLPTSIESLDMSINVEEIEIETIEITAIEPPQNTSGLSGQVKEWLNSSWDTSWGDIKNKK